MGVDSVSKYGIDHQKETEEIIFGFANTITGFENLVFTICWASNSRLLYFGANHFPNCVD